MKLHISLAGLEPDENPTVLVTDSANVVHTLALPDQGNCFVELNVFYPVTIQLQNPLEINTGTTGTFTAKEPEPETAKEPEPLQIKKSFLEKMFR